MKRICLTFFLLLMTSTLSVFAENGMNSPYTRFGFGQLASLDLGFSKAMGGTGIGIRNSNQINLLNPAAYSSVDTLTFIMDMGLSLQNTNFAENNVRRNARNTTFDYISMQYRLRKGLGMTLGFVPFSNVGYEYSNTGTIRDDEDGIVTTTNKFSGNGGISRIMTGLGWEPIKGMSLGANVSYLYGSIQHYVYNQYNESTISARTKLYTADYSTVTFDFGAQAHFEKGKNQFCIGATYALGKSFANRPYIVDYIVTGNLATSADTMWCKPFSTPESYGAGFSYKYDDRLTIAADYSIQQYGSVLFFNVPGTNRHRASIGVEYIPENYSRKFFRRMHYRAGLHYATSYYSINGVDGPNEYGASIGLGIPIINSYNQRSTINVSGQVIHQQPSLPGMITENYMRLNISVSFIENWFSKWRVN